MATAAAAQPSPVPGARPWNPEFKHSERERWICIYPTYVNSKKSLAEGRRIPKEKAVENPSYQEIRDVCVDAGLVLGVENKVHPRERDTRDLKYRGRIRVQLKDDDGAPVNEKFPNRQAVLLYLGETIPKLKARLQGGGGSSQVGTQPASGGSKSGGGKKKKGKNK